MSDKFSTSSICFERNDFNLYLFVLITFIVYLLYIITVINKPVTLPTNDVNVTNKINELQNQIKLIANNKIQNRNTQIQRIPLQTNDISLQNKFLDKLYNPLSGIWK
jgi:hypothetical protein